MIQVNVWSRSRPKSKKYYMNYRHLGNSYSISYFSRKDQKSIRAITHPNCIIFSPQKSNFKHKLKEKPIFFNGIYVMPKKSFIWSINISLFTLRYLRAAPASRSWPWQNFGMNCKRAYIFRACSPSPLSPTIMNTPQSWRLGREDSCHNLIMATVTRREL